MARFEMEVQGGFEEWVRWLDEELPYMSMTSNLEESIDRKDGETNLSIRAYERYSMMGSNRLGLTVVLLDSAGGLWISAVATGGSQAMFFKINTFGEESFMKAFIQEVQWKNDTFR